MFRRECSRCSVHASRECRSSSESVRTAAAAALGRLADKAPGAAVPALERALHDRSYDVASSAVPGLARAAEIYAGRQAIYPLRSATELRTLFEQAGFGIEQLSIATIATM